MVKKTVEQKKPLITLKNFTILEKKLLVFFKDYIEILSDANYDLKHGETKGKGLKILTHKQMLQRLPIAFAQVKAANNSERLLNEIRQIVYSLYSSKQVTKKIYNNIIKFINI